MERSNMIKTLWNRLNFVLATILLVSIIAAFAYGANAELQKRNEVGKINLTKNQVNILKAYGFSEEEIANIDLQTIRDTLRNGTIVDSSRFGDEPKYGTNDIPSHLEKIIASKNLSDRQMKGLRQRGYTYEEIAEMDIETIESILSLSHY